MVKERQEKAVKTNTGKKTKKLRDKRRVVGLKSRDVTFFLLEKMFDFFQWPH